MTPQQKSQLQAMLASTAGLSFAVLVGSQATGRTHALSDWDIAIQWGRQVSASARMAMTEQLRQTLRLLLQVPEERIDLIDLADARLAMRTLVAEEGQPLSIVDDLAWIRFLQNTWSELEDNEWRRQHPPCETASCMTT